MHNRVSADTSSESIRALRENGTEPIFSIDESLSLDEILAEIDWSSFHEEEEGQGSLFDSTREPVYHLDDSIENQIAPTGPTRRRADDVLLLPDW